MSSLANVDGVSISGDEVTSSEAVHWGLRSLRISRVWGPKHPFRFLPPFLCQGWCQVRISGRELLLRHLIQRDNSLEKTLMLTKIEGKRRRG